MVSSWQLLFSFFALMANSLPDLDIDLRRNNKAAWEWTLDSDESNARIALPTTAAGRSEIAQPPGGGDVLISDISFPNGTGRCASDTNGFPRRIRARDVKSCVGNFRQFSSGEENGRQLPPVKPSAQKGGGGLNSGGSGDPEFRVKLPKEHDLLQFLFIPRENRPTRNPELCPDPGRPFPICGRPWDTYTSINRVAPGLVVDPAYLCTFSSYPPFFFFFPITLITEKMRFSTRSWTMMLKIYMRRRARWGLYERGRR